jgi:hypothetical protein
MKGDDRNHMDFGQGFTWARLYASQINNHYKFRALLALENQVGTK